MRVLLSRVPKSRGTNYRHPFLRRLTQRQAGGERGGARGIGDGREGRASRSHEHSGTRPPPLRAHHIAAPYSTPSEDSAAARMPLPSQESLRPFFFRGKEEVLWCREKKGCARSALVCVPMGRPPRSRERIVPPPHPPHTHEFLLRRTHDEEKARRVPHRCGSGGRDERSDG